MGMIFTQGVNEISRDRDLCQPNCLLYKVLWTSINWTDSVLKPVFFVLINSRVKPKKALSERRRPYPYPNRHLLRILWKLPRNFVDTFNIYLRWDELDCSLYVRGFDERHVSAGAMWGPLAYVVTEAGTLQHWDTEPSPSLYPRLGPVWPDHMPATYILPLVLGCQNMGYLIFLEIYWINQLTIKVNKIQNYFLDHP